MPTKKQLKAHSEDLQAAVEETGDWRGILWDACNTAKGWADALDSEETRIKTAQDAAKMLARHDRLEGLEQRDWDTPEIRNGLAFSHLSVLGFSRLGTRMYSQVFVDAYRKRFEQNS